MREVIPASVLAVADALVARMWRVNLVGGAPRDFLMGALEFNDFDFEIFGATAEELHSALIGLGLHVNEIGKSFGILEVKIDEFKVQFALPRRERKTGDSHQDFEVQIDPFMSFMQAALRRDLTANAVAFSLNTNSWIDPLNGIQDIENGILRATGFRFAEDALRVMRVAQFVSRFGFSVSPETLRMCQELAPLKSTIPGDRIRDEWMKLLSGWEIGAALDFLVAAGWADSELVDMLSIQQDPRWHPEIWLWEHTKQTANWAAAMHELPKEQRAKLVLAMICHDMGKPSTTVFEEDGSITSRGHAEAGVPIAESFCKKIGMPNDWTKFVMTMTAEHMVAPDTVRAVRRLAVRLAPFSLADWANVVICDVSGRNESNFVVPKHVVNVREIEKTLEIPVAGPKPIVTGEMLMGLGFTQGRELGNVKRAAFEAQLDGAFDNESDAVAWVCAEFGCH